MQARRIVRTLSLATVLTAVAAIVMGQNVVVTVTSPGTKTIVSVPDPLPDDYRRPVDLVICLDTSGSMTALIDSARAKLWEVVNELAKIRPTPHLRVGLLTYGSPHVSTAAQGWVVRHTDLTDDLDTVYARMMALTTNGGQEYVGWVLSDALHTMSWSNDPDAMKVIVVAGNESADQAAGTFNFRHAAQQARSRRIIINAIYAGHRAQGVSEHWDQVALYGHGYFIAIDMDEGTIQIPTPQDKILIELNAELNATYVPYGAAGRKGQRNQVQQDASAARLGRQSCSSRAVAKASRLYNNSHWDLVDAEQQKDFDLSQVKREDLPEPMRDMTLKQQRAYVDGMKRARKVVREKVKEVNAAREEFLKEARAKAGSGKTSFDEALKTAIRKQAKDQNFDVKDGG